MKGLLEHETYIFETSKFEKEAIIKDENGNELGKAVGSIYDKEVELYDSQGNKWGKVKEKYGRMHVGVTYLFYNHNENLIAKTNTKKFVATLTFWVEEPEGKKKYKISEPPLSSWKYKIEDMNKTIVAQVTQELKGVFTSDYILKIKNINPLIALLIVPTIRRIKYWMEEGKFWSSFGSLARG